MENLDMMQYIDMKHESNDSSYAEDDSPNPVYMITTATQTLPCSTRKIKPIKHPGLVLKTPIAYQSNTDPSVIPIQKDGIGNFFHYLCLCAYIFANFHRFGASENYILSYLTNQSV